MDWVPVDPRLTYKRPTVGISSKHITKKPKLFVSDQEIIKQYESKVKIMNPTHIEPFSIEYHNDRSIKQYPHPTDWPEFAQFAPYHQTSEYYGSSTNTTAPLAYIFLGDFLSSFNFLQNGVDFKAYAVNMPNISLVDWKIQSSRSFPLEIFFYKWIERIWEDDESLFKYFLGVSSSKDNLKTNQQTCDIFRRCIIFTVSAQFKGSNPEVFEGHQLICMLQIKNQTKIEIVLIDCNEPSVYVYDVHQIIMECVSEYLIKSFDTKLNRKEQDLSYNVDIKYNSFNTSLLMGYEAPYMECISYALRACIYLRLLRDYTNIRESSETFLYHKNIFLHHINRMIRWIHDKKDCLDFSSTSLIKPIPSLSLEMLRPVFGLNTEECYMCLLHYSEIPPLDSFLGNDLLEKLDNMTDYIFENTCYKKFKFNKNGKKAFTQFKKYNQESMSLCRQMSRFDLF